MQGQQLEAEYMQSHSQTEVWALGEEEVREGPTVNWGICILPLRPYCWRSVLGREDSSLCCAAGLYCSPHALPLAVPVPNTHIHTFGPPPPAACGIGLPSST